MTRPKQSSRKKSRPAARKRSWWSIARRVALLGTVVFAIWCVWIDYEVRRDFKALQWALPAHLYARPIELYAGARLSADELVDYLQRLGYTRSPQVSEPGRFQASASRVRLWSYSFEFWDGEEPSRYVDVEFDGNQVRELWGDQTTGQLALVRLEPVEIAQFNPETGEDRVPVSLDQVPPALLQAIIAVEDQRFYSHVGVDPIGIMRALVANIREGRVVQGGSTLTQQLVKNLYLSRDRTLARKIEEALMALALELHFTKDEILTAYMNEIFLGQEGNRAIHGFELAAEYYFGESLIDLPLDKLAVLAGLPRGASYYNPLRNPERATERRNLVLARMHSQGYITAVEYEQARNATLQTNNRPSQKGGGYPAFMELVRNDLARDYDSAALRTEGLRIFTTLDLRVQNTMESVLDSSVRAAERPARGETRDEKLQAAVVITDASTGEVRAIAGSRTSGYTGFNRALNAVRPIGSLVKPAVYLEALKSGKFNLASVLADEPISMKLPNGQLWEPGNYDNETFGDVYLYDALERSLNLATVDLGMQVGLDKVTSMLAQLGHTRKVQPYPSMLLGAVEMAPIEVAQIYQTLASNGFRSRLRAVEAVTTNKGEPLERYGIETSQIADPASMYLLEYAMQGVFQRGTAKTVANRLDNSLPLAGKTGTTNDLRDSWFAGYGDDLVGVVWLGHDDNTETRLTGATGALRVWADIMGRLDIQPRQTLPPVDVEWRRVAQYTARDPAYRDCRTTQSLPFQITHPPDITVNCEEDESLLDRFMDRFRSLRR